MLSRSTGRSPPLELISTATSGGPVSFPSPADPTRICTVGRLWTRRQIAGFGTPQATNERYRFLLEHGQTGISTDFDHPYAHRL